MAPIVRILIADDHSIVRKGLKALLEQAGHFEVVAEAETGTEAVEKARAYRPDVAILDVRMPGLSGIEACRQIVNAVDGCKVILLTAGADDQLLYAAIQAGAAGCVLKRAGSNELIQTVDRISSGETILDASTMAVVLHEIQMGSNVQLGTEFSALTARELAVLSLVSRGMTNRQISTNLYLGEGTVRNYVSSVLAKLGVANRAEAAAFAVTHSLNELAATD